MLSSCSEVGAGTARFFVSVSGMTRAAEQDRAPGTPHAAWHAKGLNAIAGWTGAKKLFTGGL